MFAALRRAFPLFALFPLLAGAIWVAIAGLGPEASWTSSSQEAAGSPAGMTPDLSAARRAAGEASAQAGLLTGATGQLVEGTDTLSDGATALRDGINEATTGAQQLADGLVQLQAATGQLGDGATRLADGVQTAVDQVSLLPVIRGQLLEAIDGVDKDLANSIDPRAKDLREQLAGFRQQLDNAQLGDDVTTQLTELKEGSRELANQLAVSGYAYHDGIYEATNGAQQLNSGLVELAGHTGEALDGVDQLASGTGRIDELADLTRDKVGAVQRALPASAVSGTTTEASSSLNPLYALLISALAGFGGLGVGLLRRLFDAALAWLGVTVAATVLFFLLATSPTIGGSIVGIIALGLMVAATAVVTALIIRRLGMRLGGGLALLGAIVQVGLVGWLWQSAAAAAVSTWVTAVVALFPLHWATGALSAAGNSGAGELMWGGFGVLALVTILGMTGLWLERTAQVSGARQMNDGLSLPR